MMAMMKSSYGWNEAISRAASPAISNARLPATEWPLSVTSTMFSAMRKLVRSPIADRHHELAQSFLLGAFARGHQEAAAAVAHHHAVQQPDRIGDHARVEIVVDRDRLAQLLAGEVIEQRMPALRHRELAERRIVEAELVLVALAQESERGGRAEIAERGRPLAVERALAAVVLGDLRIGVETEHRRGEAGVERRRGARQRAGRRGAADVDGLAEIELEARVDPRWSATRTRCWRRSSTTTGSARRSRPFRSRSGRAVLQAFPPRFPRYRDRSSRRSWFPRSRRRRRHAKP